MTRPHQHKEAFALMWYACECGHRERIWNSRDGVTPFGTACPSCNRVSLRHTDFHRDEYAPHHQPHVGQRIWVDMTRERATWLVDQRLKREGHRPGALDRQTLIEEFFRHGTAPDLRIYGYGLQLLPFTARL